MSNVAYACLQITIARLFVIESPLLIHELSKTQKKTKPDGMQAHHTKDNRSLVSFTLGLRPVLIETTTPLCYNQQ